MTTRGCLGAGCFAIALGAAVVAMVVVSAALRLPPEPEPETTPPTRAPVRLRATPTPTPDPDRFLTHPGEWRKFAQELDGPRHRLHYGFVDYAGQRREVTCTINRAAVERASRSFGWDKTEVTGELDAELQKVVDREIERRGLTPYVRITMVDDGEWHWSVVASAADDPRAASEIGAFTAWMRKDFAKTSARIEAQIFKRHGLLLRNHIVSINYNGLAGTATRELGNCYDALALSAGPIASDRYFIGLLLAFMQELKYELPPDTVGRRDVFGLWVPTEVMTKGKGDCDSKATTFAALWRNRRSRIIVILVPQHALVGVESKPGPGESFVQVGNRYYVLCEVAGPGKLPPGYQPIRGSFEYVAIDPATAD